MVFPNFKIVNEIYNRLNFIIKILIFIVFLMPPNLLAQSWSQTSLADSIDIHDFESLGPNGPIVVATSKGIHRSLDDGLSWEPINNGIVDSAFIPKIASTSTGILFASSWFNSSGGIYRSDDTGLTWYDVSIGLPTSFTWGILTYEKGDGSFDLYCSVWLGGIYKSVDSGASWSFSGLSGITVNVLTKNQEGQIFAGCNWDTSGVFRSDDEGLTWNHFESGLNSSTVWAIDFLSDGTVLLGTDGKGVYSSSDNGVNWSYRGLNFLRIHDFEIATNDRIFAGMYYGAVYWTDPDTYNWTQVNLGGLTNLNVGAILLLNDFNLLIGTYGSGVFTGAISIGSNESPAGVVDSIPIYITNTDTIATLNIPLILERVDTLVTGNVSVDSIRIAPYWKNLDVIGSVDTIDNSIIVIRTIEDPPIPPPDTNNQQLAIIYYSSTINSVGNIAEIKADTCTDVAGACDLFFTDPAGTTISPGFSPGFIKIIDTLDVFKVGINVLEFNGSSGIAPQDSILLDHYGDIPINFNASIIGSHFVVSPNSGFTPVEIILTPSSCSEEEFTIDTLVIEDVTSTANKLYISLIYDCRCCIVDRGNVDGGPDDGTFSGSIDIGDLVFLVSYMFQGGAIPVCMKEANIDGVGEIDISDLVGLVAFMFQGGATPAVCP